MPSINREEKPVGPLSNINHFIVTEQDKHGAVVGEKTHN